MTRRSRRHRLPGPRPPPSPPRGTARQLPSPGSRQPKLTAQARLHPASPPRDLSVADASGAWPRADPPLGGAGSRAACGGRERRAWPPPPDAVHDGRLRGRASGSFWRKEFARRRLRAYGSFCRFSAILQLPRGQRAPLASAAPGSSRLLQAERWRHVGLSPKLQPVRR